MAQKSGNDNYNGDKTTGFASPAQDYVENTIDLTDTLELRRPSRYLVRVTGDELDHRGIRHNDIIVADSARAPRAGGVVIACVSGEMLVCEIGQDKRGWYLRPSRALDMPVYLSEHIDASIWAVAVSLVREEL
ncbi:S24 family peptidase [Aristophania vespae]|uniref:S24 family peptidase n=1 Tax=Aristophania vespae TaxID=2697033 RepID=A0A6P1NG57_9PROT|nr:S24 family peptidase [Aristophania vespae]QHI95510.1 S24 family peptidase [Aristophania vespae]UMM63134.1 Protein UmuD [Aristophania vespae]